MKKGWKIALISVGSLLGVVVIVAAVALWLVFTPSQLTKIVNGLAGRYVNAETHFERVDLTLFRTFPDAGLKIDNVYIVNPTDGAPSDTVARLGSLTVGVDIKRFIKENEVIVHQVLLDDVHANLYIGPDGQSNFDIFPSGEDDTTSTPFSLDSLPMMDLHRIKASNLNATFVSEQNNMKAAVEKLDLGVTGTLKEGRVDARLDLDGKTIVLDMYDSAGAPSLALLLQGLGLTLKGEGNLDEVGGKLKMKVEKGQFNDMVNEQLQASKKNLLTLEVPFEADLQQMFISLKDEARLKLDDYTLTIGGNAQLATDSLPMAVDVAMSTDGSWQVEPLLKIVPAQFVGFADGMDIDAKVELQATAKGTLTDSTIPLIDAQVKLADGRFYMPSALPYKINKIKGDMEAHLDLGKTGVSHAVVNSLHAHTRGTDLNVSGRADDLLGDMRIDATVKGTMPLEDAMPMVPDSLGIKADGKADINLKARLSLSQLKDQAFEKMQASGTMKFANLVFDMDSLHAEAPKLDIALQLPAKEHSGKLADAHIIGSGLQVDMGNIKAAVEKPDINIGVNNPTKEQVAAAFDVAVGETEATIDLMMVSLGALELKGTMRMDSTQENPLRRFNPVADIDMHSAVLYMPELPDAVRLSQFSFEYKPENCELRTAEVKVGHSDFQLYGTVENLEEWLSHEDMLTADLNFTSSYADIDQLMDMISGMGSDADSLEQMREEDQVPTDANPFIVPKDVDVTLHTHIQRSVAFGNDLNDVAGALTVKDGVAVLDQIGFVCKAATMQLTALYKSPRPNNLFVALDFHLLDIQIDELLDMIPAVDTLVPMLAAFNGNANFHLAAETFLNAKYEPKMSSLLGSAAISGRDLVVMDNNSISQIAKLMQFKSWKDKDNKIRIDSLDVEMTCFRKEIEVYPFLLNIGKYQLCASGKHNLDNNCGYHVELLKNPLMAKVGVDVRGNLSSPKITLGEVRYADLYKPEKQGVVEQQTLKLKKMIREALEANVR